MFIPQFSAEHGIMNRAAEFVCFCRISTFWRNFADFGTGRWKGDEYGIFWPGSGSRRKLITTFRDDCSMKYMTGTPAVMGGILKILNLIWNTASLFGTVFRSVSCGYWRKILHICWVQKIIAMWKICRNELRNLANWPGEFGKICCGELWSLSAVTQQLTLCRTNHVGCFFFITSLFWEQCCMM